MQVEAEYRMPVEHHNPMETFAATAVWEERRPDHVFDKTQGPQNCRNYVASVFGMPLDKVRVLSLTSEAHSDRGCVRKPQLPLAVLAARALKRPVRVTSPASRCSRSAIAAGIQELALGADSDGSLASFRHDVVR